MAYAGFIKHIQRSVQPVYAFVAAVVVCGGVFTGNGHGFFRFSKRVGAIPAAGRAVVSIRLSAKQTNNLKLQPAWK